MLTITNLVKFTVIHYVLKLEIEIEYRVDSMNILQSQWDSAASLKGAENHFHKWLRTEDETNNGADTAEVLTSFRPRLCVPDGRFNQRLIDRLWQLPFYSGYGHN